jgi:hypothetical protein
MNVLNLFLQNWDSVLLVVVFIAFVIFLWVRGEKGVVFKILYNLVTEAEKQYGNGTGSLKQAAVIDWVYDRLPAVLKLFVTAATLERWVDEAVERAKAEWGKNENIKEYIQSGQPITLTTTPAGTTIDKAFLTEP